jgi:hypothetical protein
LPNGDLDVPVIVCPNCREKYRVGREFIGVLVVCRHCRTEWVAIARRGIDPRITVIAVLFIFASPIMLVVLYLITSGGTGSASGAAELRAIVEPISDPEAGEGVDYQYAAKRFPNGEWVLSVSRDSHGVFSRFRGGGTIVFKDSRGQIRCFFGHVCGPRGQAPLVGSARSLDLLYRTLADQGFTEYEWP